MAQIFVSPQEYSFLNSPCGFSSSVCLQLSLEPCQPSPCSDPACVEILTHALITSRPRYCNSPLAASVNLYCVNSPECCLLPQPGKQVWVSPSFWLVLALLSLQFPLPLCWPCPWLTLLPPSSLCIPACAVSQP